MSTSKIHCFVDKSVRKGFCMEVFQLGENLIDAYSEYASSLIWIRDPQIKSKVVQSLAGGQCGSEPPIQLDSRFDDGDSKPMPVVRSPWPSRSKTSTLRPNLASAPAR